MPKKCLMCDGTKINDSGTQCEYCEGSGFDIEYTDKPICPHCGHEHVDDFEIGLKDWSDGEEVVTACDSCGNDFRLTLGVTYSYSTTKKVEG